VKKDRFSVVRSADIGCPHKLLLNPFFTDPAVFHLPPMHRITDLRIPQYTCVNVRLLCLAKPTSAMHKPNGVHICLVSFHMNPHDCVVLSDTFSDDVTVGTAELVVAYIDMEQLLIGRECVCQEFCCDRCTPATQCIKRKVQDSYGLVLGERVSELYSSVSPYLVPVKVELL
jgi:hypothetical protein